MGATASDLAAGITPGSLEQGNRAPLEAGLAGALAPTQGGPSPQAGAPAPPVDSTTDPLGALLGGGIDPGGQGDPLTSGLSVGPGPGVSGAEPQQDPKMVRLQQLATQAASPLLRAAARNALRSLVRETI